MSVTTEATALSLTPDTADGVKPLLEAIASLSTASLGEIAQRLHEATLPYMRSRALVIFTEDCTGRPQKKSGDEDVISQVSIAELDAIKATLSGDETWQGRAPIGGREHPVVALPSPTNALLVLVEPRPVTGESGAEPSGQEVTVPWLVRYLWNLAAERIREKVADAPPSYLIESRAASAERVRVTAELVDRHSTTLETLLAALRAPSLADDAARKSATDLAAKALVELRTLNDRTTELVEEPVATAFQRLREDLRPLMHFSGIDVQFIEPPVNGRALPGEVAHAARAIVRGLVLAMVEQPDVRRIRTQWDCDGENLLINVRDDGQGNLSREAPSIVRLLQRVEVLDGRMTIDLMKGWGADVAVTLPLDPPERKLPDVGAWNLGDRELEVLQLLAAGQRNRAIAAMLHVSENTVKFHLRNIYRKLGATSRTEAIALAHSNGLR
ncbi:LuxR C-terminal-related transcriptional regulator [Arthrobacter sp. NPDC058097]|uniref:helix-turn-helix transcriptional regulator n=1 Tax=Arthrobacter sp. NPDC058097 TaxID=3346340 RepID=UPI0036DAA3C8